MKLNYFNFKSFNDKVLLTNDFGEHLFVSIDDFNRIMKKNLDSETDLYKKLIDKRMVFNETNLTFSSLFKSDMRSAKNHINTATSLHIFVVTTACNMSCVYCQANNGKSHSPIYMSKEIAERSVDISLQSPAHYLTFEFQGGEPLLNFDVIRHIVLYAEEHKGTHEINYNVVTNLTALTDDMIEFFCEYSFGVSTSIDGPEAVHNSNRPFCNGHGTFKEAIASVEKLRKKGLRVGAIQTTTRTSLKYSKEIVDTYFDLGFDSIFIRPLTPLGKATVNWDEIGYTAGEFLRFYFSALDELLKINRNGHFFKEDHASILLSRIDGNYVNYMELRSPCGAGIGQLAYYADGNVFTCDEGRMLYEMGDAAFCLGNVCHNDYQSIIKNSVCKTVCASSILEALPSCCDCVYQPYCGTCPVVNYSQTNDLIEKSPRGYRCKIYSGMLDYLFNLLYENNEEITNILHSWGN